MDINIDDLSDDELKVCHKIYEFDEVKQEKIWQVKLADVLKDELPSINAIPGILKELRDRRIISSFSRLKKNKKGGSNWVKVLIITEGAKEFVKKSYENSIKGEKTPSFYLSSCQIDLNLLRLKAEETSY